MNVIDVAVVVTSTPVMSTIRPDEGPTVPVEVVADALEIVIGPKFGTVETPDEGYSSRIHSALVSHKAAVDEGAVRVLVTVFPLVTFWIATVPAVVEVAVTVILTVSPALNVMPEKS